MFHSELQQKLHQFVLAIYRATRTFPREEQYGVTSQLRRASLSILLNYVEGNASRRPPVMKRQLEIAYGSLRESQTLIDISQELNYIDQPQHQQLRQNLDGIAKMLWGILQKL